MNSQCAEKIQGDVAVLMRLLGGRVDTTVANNAYAVEHYLEKKKITGPDAVTLARLYKEYNVPGIIDGFERRTDPSGNYKNAKVLLEKLMQELNITK